MVAGGLARVFLSTGPDTTGDDVADLQRALSLPAGSMAMQPMLARRSARRLLRGRAAGRGTGPVREGWARIPEGQRRHDSRARPAHLHPRRTVRRQPTKTRTVTCKGAHDSCHIPRASCHISRLLLQGCDLNWRLGITGSSERRRRCSQRRSWRSASWRGTLTRVTPLYSESDTMALKNAATLGARVLAVKRERECMPDV
jgi:hypothetical protein